MALKDWKKVKGKEFEFKNDKKGTIISVKETGYITEDKYALYWDFYLPNGKRRGETPIKDFKTKQEALKYAKEYMRKN